MNRVEIRWAWHIVAGAAYDSDAIHKQAWELKATVCIRPAPALRREKRYDMRRYRHRNVIERFFCRIKRCRRVATRYEKKACNFASYVWLASLVPVPF